MTSFQMTEHFTTLSKIDFLPELRQATLHEKAVLLQDLIEANFYSPKGTFYSLLMIDGEQSVRPMTKQEVQSVEWYKHQDEHLDRCLLEEEGVLFENSLTSAGIYLQAMVSRYRVTQDPQAMQAAMRVYRSIKQIYDWGKEAGRAGHLSKPYGDVATLTSTPDQYLFALTGLYWFYKLPDCPVQDEIEQIFIDCAEFCMNRDYQVCYLSSWNMISEVGAYNAIYMLIPFLAYLVTNQERYLEEMNRVAQLGHWRTESYLGPWAREGLERMLMFERVCLAHFALSPAEIFAREYPRIFGVTPDEQQRTLAHLSEEWWKFGALGIDEDDYSNYWVDIDVRNATWRSTGLTPLQPKAEGSENEFNGDYFFIRYYSDVKFPPPLYRQIHNSLILYNHATDSQRQTEAKAMFLRLLHKTDGNRLRWMIDLDGQQLLPEIKYHCCILDSEAPFHYLYMYWRGVEQGLI